eukprot:394571-Amphidinium_carterae.1
MFATTLRRKELGILDLCSLKSLKCIVSTNHGFSGSGFYLCLPRRCGLCFRRPIAGTLAAEAGHNHWTSLLKPKGKPMRVWPTTCADLGEHLYSAPAFASMYLVGNQPAYPQIHPSNHEPVHITTQTANQELHRPRGRAGKGFVNLSRASNAPKRG